MRIYLYVGIVIAVLAALAYGYASAYKSGKESIVAKLQEDKIVVLENGKKIDEKVLSADDPALICMLIDCSVNPAL